MPLRIVEEGRYEKPLILCDQCGERIARAIDGYYLWRYDSRSDFPGFAVYFTHQACEEAFEDANDGDWGMVALDCLFVYLSNNLDLDWQTANRKAWRLDE
jgi:hypothetical protein